MLKEREELYINLIKNSNSLIEVCRKANIVPTTGNYDTLKKIIKENNIDISHFKRLGGANSGIKKETSEYLINGSYITSFKLKNKLLKEGYKEYKCENCKNTEWYGKPIPLELHHINGNHTDNRIENLQLLCPNCHALTDNYSGKNQKLNINKKEELEKTPRNLNKEEKNKIVSTSYNNDSIKEIANLTKHSEKTVKKILEQNSIVVNKNKKIKENNDKKILSIIESLKKTRSFSGTAREFGVSGNAIKKLLVRRGYPSHIKDLLNAID